MHSFDLERVNWNALSDDDDMGDLTPDGIDESDDMDDDDDQW